MKVQSVQQSQEDINMKEKVVLAYSGGLDTSVIIPWLKENYGCEVIACTVNLGQPEDFDAIHEKALKSGASVAETLDVRKEFIEEYAYNVLKADGIYEGKYLLGTSFARPLIGKCLVDMAKKYGADAICHGATGKGNDQVRFELTIKALAPHMKIIAPWRIWDMKSREDEMKYAEEHGVPIDKYDEKQSEEEKAAQKYPYSMDWNMWHLSHEGDDLENPANAPHKDMYLVTCDPEDAPDKPEFVSIDFEAGVPVAVNGKKMDGVELVNTLNAIGAKNGVGINDLVENTLVGMKSRGVYETPGGTILIEAHKQLEELVLDRATMEVKKEMGDKLAQVVYEGKWFTPLREAIQAFVTSTQEYVTGEVKFKLYKGNIIKAGTTSPYSLYSESLASFTTGDLYDHHDADGFITLFGLPLKVRAMKMQELKKNNTSTN